jgi:acetylornithine deacetylase/succinyl-diaminopimelate desuccinylase family protein
LGTKPKADCTVIETLEDLVRINSVNPNYAGGVNELELAEYVEQFFALRGIECWRQTVYPDRPNIIARLAGADPSRRVILEAHLDTVSVQGMTIAPWEPAIRDGQLFGRGACDTKGGLAAMMHAVARVAQEELVPACDVWFAATIDEEFSYRGVWALCNDPPLEGVAAIVAEPTDLQPVIASKGVVRFKLETLGQSAHSSKPHLGVNAIEQMARVIMALEQDTRQLATQQHPLLGPATCNVGVIRGGVQVNFVPDRCEIEVDRRLLPHETQAQVLAHFQQLLDDLSQPPHSIRAVMHPPLLTDLPLETDPQEPAVQTLVAVLSELGLPTELVGVPFGSDASKFGARGIPSMILGPGSIDQAHAAVEFVDCQQVVTAAEIYFRYLMRFR